MFSFKTKQRKPKQTKTKQQKKEEKLTEDSHTITRILMLELNVNINYHAFYSET